MKSILRAALLVLLSLCFFIIFMTSLQPQMGGFLYGSEEYEVRVINGFRTNSSLPLVIWCSSEHVNLGGRALQEGDDFSWSLTTGMFLWRGIITTGNDGYFCTVKWDTKRKRFSAFKGERDRERCRTSRKCCWLVKEDGFYFSNDEVHWVKDFEFSWL